MFIVVQMNAVNFSAFTQREELNDIKEDKMCKDLREPFVAIIRLMLDEDACEDDLVEKVGPDKETDDKVLVKIVGAAPFRIRRRRIFDARPLTGFVMMAFLKTSCTDDSMLWYYR